MTTMIERVAISQSEFDGRPWMSMPKGERDRYMGRAHAAIEAMREPNAAMIKANLDSCPLAPSGMDGREADNYCAAEEYKAMIDAALKDQP